MTSLPSSSFMSRTAGPDAPNAAPTLDRTSDVDLESNMARLKKADYPGGSVFAHRVNRLLPENKSMTRSNKAYSRRGEILSHERFLNRPIFRPCGAFGR
jgi:hypothetical protein